MIEQVTSKQAVQTDLAVRCNGIDVYYYRNITTGTRMLSSTPFTSSKMCPQRMRLLP